MLPESFTYLDHIDNTILYYIRYAGSMNFVGKIIDGYNIVHSHFLTIDYLRILTDPICSYWRLKDKHCFERFCFGLDIHTDATLIASSSFLARSRRSSALQAWKSTGRSESRQRRCSCRRARDRMPLRSRAYKHAHGAHR